MYIVIGFVYKVDMNVNFDAYIVQQMETTFITYCNFVE